MSESKQYALRKRIGEFLKSHENWKKIEVVNHFIEEGIPVKTIYCIIKRFEEGLTADRKPGSGSNNAISQRKKDKIIENSVNEIGISYAAIGRKHGVTGISAKKILSDAGVERRPRVKCPKKY